MHQPSPYYAPSNSCQTFIVTFLAGLLPLSLLLPVNLKELPPALLFLYGIYLLISDRRVRQQFCKAWPVLLGVNLILVWAIVDTLIWQQSASDFDRPVHILLYTIVSAVFIRNIHFASWWRWLAVLSIGLGIVCIYQHVYLDLDRARAPGRSYSSAIVFAIILASLALTSLTLLIRAELTSGDKCLQVLGLVFAMTGLILTQSRGPILAMLPVFLILLYMQARHVGHYRYALAWLAAIMIGIAAIITLSHGAMIKRMPEIGQQIKQFNTGKVKGSTSQRLEMWRVAIQGFKEHPLTGVGIGNYQNYVKQEIKAGRASKAIQKFNSPHNLYLTYAVEGGIPAVFILLLALACPLWWFSRYLNHSDNHKAVAAWVGFALMLQYLLSAMAENIFGWTLSISFLFFMVLGLSVYLTSEPRISDTPIT